MFPMQIISKASHRNYIVKNIIYSLNDKHGKDSVKLQRLFPFQSDR